MIGWIRLAFIVSVVALDDVLRELVLSIAATKDFLRDRVRWILVEKLRSMWRGLLR